MDLGLHGKIALVTGASRGLGFAVAEQLAAEGARVGINSRSPQNLEQSAESIRSNTGGDVIVLAGDVTDPAIPEQIIAKLVASWGGLDIIVANAGGPPSGAFESFSDDDWYQAIELSFLSQMRLIRSALPHLRKSSAASVLAVTSFSVKQPIPNLVLSNSIRMATIGLIKTLSIELGSQSIRFNSILPGWTETTRMSSLLENRAKQKGTSSDTEKQLIATDIPLGRVGSPEEFAKAAVFIVSPAGSYINGVMLPVDGGLIKSV